MSDFELVNTTSGEQRVYIKGWEDEDFPIGMNKEDFFKNTADRQVLHQISDAFAFLLMNRNLH